MSSDSYKNSLVLPAPAKLNLFLHITAQREDGYHLLQTVFQLLDYGDEVQLSLRDDKDIIRIEEGLSNSLKNIPPESDLCIRAATLLQTHAQVNQGASIKLTKRLPIGGGIGGGSSDAATVLHGLNVLWSCGLSDDELAQLGLELGADVPVFVRGYSAWAEGVGEQISPITLPEKWFVVLRPDVSVSTAEIFTDQGLTRDCETLTISRFLAGSQFETLSNVFEPIVSKKYPQIATAINWLSTYSPARLTGTGSCIFASFENENKAKQVLEALAKSPHNWQGFVAKGVNQSPLKVALQN